MYKLCKTEQSAKRQREIEKVFYQILKDSDYQSITVTEICLQANIPRKAFYRYFDCKEDVLCAMIEHKMFEYGGFLYDYSKTKRTVKQEIEKFFSFWYENREFLCVLDKNNLLDRLFQIAVDFPIKDFVILSKYLPDDDECSKVKIFSFAVCGLIYEVMCWYKEGFKTGVKEMSEIAYRMLSRPIFSNLDQIINDD